MEDSRSEVAYKRGHHLSASVRFLGLPKRFVAYAEGSREARRNPPDCHVNMLVHLNVNEPEMKTSRFSGTFTCTCLVKSRDHP